MIKLIYGTFDDFLTEYPRMDEVLKLATDSKNDMLVEAIVNFYLKWQMFNMRYAISEQDWIKDNNE